LFPLPNVSGQTGYNYASQVSGHQPRREDLLRVDYNISSKWRVFGHYINNAQPIVYPYGFSRNFRAGLIARKCSKTWNAGNVLLLMANGFSPEPCPGSPSRPLRSQTKLCRASGRLSGSDRGFRYCFRCALSGMPPCFAFSPQPVFAGLT
jgi:hypothetical protein